MTTCPKCQYQRQPHDNAPEWQCPSCGVAYNKVAAMAGDVAPARASRQAGRAAKGGSGARTLLIVVAVGLLILLAAVRAFWGLTHRHSAAAAAATTSAGASATGAPASGGDALAAAGFEGLAWGADDRAIKARFGDALQRLSPPDQFFGAHADFVIEPYQLEGVPMRVSFQMSDSGSGLMRVLLGRLMHRPDGQNYLDNYNHLLERMTQQLGKPVCKDDIDCMWTKGDTEIELDYRYQPRVIENLTLMYRPARKS